MSFENIFTRVKPYILQLKTHNSKDELESQ